MTKFILGVLYIVTYHHDALIRTKQSCIRLYTTMKGRN